MDFRNQDWSARPQYVHGQNCFSPSLGSFKLKKKNVLVLIDIMIVPFKLKKKKIPEEVNLGSPISS